VLHSGSKEADSVTPANSVRAICRPGRCCIQTTASGKFLESDYRHCGLTAQWKSKSEIMKTPERQRRLGAWWATMSHNKLAVLSGNRKHGRVLEERKLLSAASSSKPMTLLDLRDLERVSTVSRSHVTIPNRYPDAFQQVIQIRAYSRNTPRFRCAIAKCLFGPHTVYGPAIFEYAVVAAASSLLKTHIHAN
jgi:hypothetical protein